MVETLPDAKERYRIVKGDCVEFLKTLPPNSIDSVVCDPPYGLEFMGKEWDRLTTETRGGSVAEIIAGESTDPSHPFRNGSPRVAYGKDRKTDGGYLGAVGEGRSTAPVKATGDLSDRLGPLPNFGSGRNLRCGKCGHWRFSGTPCVCPEPDFPNLRLIDATEIQKWHFLWAVEVFRVLKPGGHLLAFSGSRTYHRLAVAVEDAGFEIRDMISWMYGNGFPKSHDISKAFDKGHEAERGYLAKPTGGLHAGTGTTVAFGTGEPGRQLADNPITPLAKKYSGWGTALKPSNEPIVVARKPLIGTLVENITKFGTGGLNITATRVGFVAGEESPSIERRAGPAPAGRSIYHNDGRKTAPTPNPSAFGAEAHGSEVIGRWPPNLLLSHLSVPMLCLRSDCPREVRDVIRAYYGDRESVRGMRNDLQGNAEPDSDSPVLFAAVRGDAGSPKSGGSIGGDSTSSMDDVDLPSLRNAVSGDSGLGQERTPEVLLEGVSQRVLGDARVAGDPEARSRTYRGGTSEDETGRARTSGEGAVESMEGRQVPDSVSGERDLLDGDGGHPSGTGPHVRQGDDSRSVDQVHIRASGVRGGSYGSSASRDGDCSPPKRGQGGQPDGESDRDNAGSALVGSPSGRTGDDQDAGGERATASRDRRFEIEAFRVPVGWREHFEYAGDAGCRRIGLKTIDANSYFPDQKVTGYGPNLGGGSRTEALPGPRPETETVEDWDCVEDCPVRNLNLQSGESELKPQIIRPTIASKIYGGGKGIPPITREHDYSDSGGASRFFPTFSPDVEESSLVYTPKASRSEREAGVDPKNVEGTRPDIGNDHATVKPIALMRWLIKLVTPPGGLVCDPFLGSGTTGAAAVIDGFRFLGIEREADYIRIAEQRIAYWIRQPIYAAPRVALQKDPGVDVAEGTSTMDDEW